jgi:L-lactate dehydrogenase complex protein LldG
MRSSSRAAVLASIRGALSHRTEEQAAALQARQGTPPVWTRPAFGSGDVDRFVSRAQSSLCTVERLAHARDIAPAVARQMAMRGLASEISVAPALQPAGWPGDWPINFGAGRVTESVAVTDALAGIAETGSLVFISHADRPSGLNFLPELHIAVLNIGCIVHHMEDVWPKVRALPDWPRAVNIISAPSRTADVGQIVVRPAHGPKALHILLVGAQE